MKIDRIKAEKVFRDYVSAYNAQDDKVRLKIEHTFRVAVLCEKIAASLGMAEDERDLAWFTGLLHDVGRFEQLRNYGTFIDAESIDHAMYGAQILFDEGKIRDYTEDSCEDGLLRTVVGVHSAYRIPEGLDERTQRFCHILRDADHLAGHISLVYELVFPESLRIVLEQGYLSKLMAFESENPVTREQFCRMKEYMELYVKRIQAAE